EATALAHCETSLKLAQVIGNRSTIASAFNNLGLVHFEAGNFAIAEENAREAVKILEVLFDNIKADPNAQVALGETLITYNLLQRILVAQEKYGEALVVAEEGRAKASINLLSQRLGSTVDLSQLEGALSLADIQQTAKENNVTIVEYSLILESYLNHGTVRGSTAEIYIWVVHPSGEIDFRQVPLTSENEIFQDLIAHLRKSLGIPNRGGLAPRTASTIDQQAQLKDLYELLIAPVEALLPNDPTQQVVIIPQRELFSIPFAALQDEDDTYLIENHTLSVAPAAKIFRLTQHQQFTKPRQAKWGENSLILGNPQMPDVRLSPNQPAQRLSSLPGAEKEAESIAQLLETAALINDQATEAAVKQKLPEAQLIHFATHGLLEYGRPEASGIRDIPGALALTPDNQEDGLLTAAEILDLQLQANLVVLSACDTGRGTVTDDGVNGLSLSFIMAGAPSVVVSLWAVPDAPTAALMTEFYSQLQQGKNKSQALRQAMLTTMETHPDPRDWAAFILIGATD
ncbi:MAG: CHAT domain-containing tetratricopeptide repeat protein, partial [Cyanobacteria bacterium J06555_13]